MESNRKQRIPKVKSSGNSPEDDYLFKRPRRDLMECDDVDCDIVFESMEVEDVDNSENDDETVSEDDNEETMEGAVGGIGIIKSSASDDSFEIVFTTENSDSDLSESMNILDSSDSSDSSDSDDDDEDKETERRTNKQKTKKKIKSKTVRFASESSLVQVHSMVTWNYAYRQARIGQWEQDARDRVRFNNKITQLSNVISPILNVNHREQVFSKYYEEKLNQPSTSSSFH